MTSSKPDDSIILENYSSYFFGVGGGLMCLFMSVSSLVDLIKF